MADPDEQLELRVHSASVGPTLIYLPGLHGDWTLVGSFREALAHRATLVEITYPRTLTWTLADYGQAVAAALVRQGFTSGWLLAESFGSQVAWAIIADAARSWQPAGVVFAGGFVRYSPRWLVRAGERAFRAVPNRSLARPLRAYVAVVRLMRYRGQPPPPDLEEFVRRRTEADQRAAAHRLHLITESDWRDVARNTHLPVFHLTGLWDPVVPWWPVHRWLRRHCPGFRAARILPWSDHNVLGCASRQAADQVLAWIQAHSP
jgi:pimeloyl-ACP methyl ester carboxylesterase